MGVSLRRVTWTPRNIGESDLDPGDRKGQCPGLGRGTERELTWTLGKTGDSDLDSGREKGTVTWTPEREGHSALHGGGQ